jgi:hypothetical protein
MANGLKKQYRPHNNTLQATPLRGLVSWHNLIMRGSLELRGDSAKAAARLNPTVGQRSVVVKTHNEATGGMFIQI